MNKYVIVDIDGTIADCTERANKYLNGENKDWDAFYNACANDLPIKNILSLVLALMESGAKIVFFTGRRESCREATSKWLNTYLGLLDPEIFMRQDDDHRHDTEVKPEMLESFYKQHGINANDIWLILEDRNSMVAKWRQLGFTCLQTAEGDF